MQQTFHLVIAIIGLVALLVFGAFHLVRRRRNAGAGGTRGSGTKP
ncbi:LPXTG cell wall anchor domain-containing protein [Micromonospora sp. CA-240977]